MRTLPPELARVLAAERHRVVPFIGTGLSLAANVPGTSEVAAELREVAAGEGLDIAEGAGWEGTCEAFEAHYGLERMQEVTAEFIRKTEPEPDAALLAAVRCPSRIVVTSNYDFAAEEAIRRTGREPATFWLDQAQAWTPDLRANTVHVVHIHGHLDRPETMVFPGRSTEALEDDERFQTVLRALSAPRLVLYLGFSFGPAETHLRNELDWLRRSFTDAGDHHLLLPEQETRARGAELKELLDKPNVHAHLYDDAAGGHAPVRYASLVLAPESPAHPEHVSARAPSPDEYFFPPSMLLSKPGEDATRLDARAISVELQLGTDQFALPNDMLLAQRVVIDGSPGMGKTQALLAAGAGSSDWHALYLRLTTLATEEAGEPLTTALRGLANAQAFDTTTPRPTRESLDDGAYAVLLDGFDEVGVARRATVLAAVAALIERYPQHVYVLATRPTVDIAPLYELGFTRFALVANEPWGRRYLGHRSIPDETVDEVAGRVPALAELLGVPIYAAAIADRLARGDEIPADPVALLVGVARDAAEVESEREGTGTEEMLAYLQLLGAALELLGWGEASTEQLAAITGKGMPEAERLRQGMVERALIQDREGVVAFPSRTIREALCAEAILRTTDPVATVRELAVAELAGEGVLRGDMEQVLDFVWESADDDTRRALWDIDDLRGARTQRPDGSDDVDRALAVLWDWFERRRLWLSDDHGNRQHRGAQTAVERLLRAEPEKAEARREALVEATRAERPTTRANAVTWLTAVPAESEDETMRWLAERLADEHPVVTRHACVAAERLGVRAALPVVIARLDEEMDEAALEGLAYTALALAGEDAVSEIADVIYRKHPRLWPKLSPYFLERLDVDDLLRLLGSQRTDREVWETTVEAALDREQPHDWQPEQVRLLSKALVLGARGGDLLSLVDRVRPIVAAHPEAAIQGAEDALVDNDEVLTIDLIFLDELPKEQLEAAAEGPLGDLLLPYVDRPDIEELRPRGQPAVTAQPRRVRHEARRASRQPTETPDPDALPLHVALARGLYAPDRPPRSRRSWPTDGLSAELTRRLEELVAAWWPDEPVHRLITHTDTGLEAASGEVLSVVLAAAAIRKSLTPDEWVDVFASGTLRYAERGITAWLAQEYTAECEPGAVEVIASITDPFHLYSAANALPELTPNTAEALAARTSHLDGDAYLRAVLERIANAGYEHIIETILEGETDQGRTLVMQRVLAGRGQAEAQLAVAEYALQTVRDGSRPDPDLFDWSASGSDERLVGPLAELLGELGDGPDPSDRLQQAVRVTLATTRSEAALVAYDRLASDESRPNRAFHWYPRAELAGTMAAETVQSRLPDTPAEMLARLRQLGFPG